jgi:pentatricopeptide repeat protein
MRLLSAVLKDGKWKEVIDLLRLMQSKTLHGTYSSISEDQNPLALLQPAH